MRKQGPCRHCGITSTPLWRNGPPEKPVLCNACGSRWRTKGTLKNYTPLHCRGPLEEEYSVASEGSSFRSIEQKLGRRKHDAQNNKCEYDNDTTRRVKDLQSGLHDNLSNWSSSGSAISFAESCSHFSIADSSEVTGSIRSNIHDCLTPSWKRKPETQPRTSPVEKLTKDLHSILHQHPLYFAESSEDDLLYDNTSSADYTEIGHGGFLIGQLNSTTKESGSTSSSFPVLRNKRIHFDSALKEDIWSGGADSSMDNDIGLMKEAQESPERFLLRSLSQEECQNMLSRDSDLTSVDMKDIINYDIFMAHLTPEEQEKLMKFLPSTDINKYPESVKMMFSTLQFEEMLHSFQELIGEGVLDQSSYMGGVFDLQTLQRLVFLGPTNGSWVEHYTRIKAAKYREASRVGETDCEKGFQINLPRATSLRRSNSSLAIESREPKITRRSPRKKSKMWMFDNHSPNSLSTNLTTICPQENQVELERSGFNPDSFFSSPLESSVTDPCQPSSYDSYENILIDVSSSSSFPEAVLLSDIWEGKSR